MRKPSPRQVDHVGDARLVRHRVGTRTYGIRILGQASFQLQAALGRLPRRWWLPPGSARCLCPVCEQALLPTPVLLLRSEGHCGGFAALCEEACRRDDPDSLLPQHLRPGRSAALHEKSKPDMCPQEL